MAAEELAQLLGRGAPRNPNRESLEAWGRALGAVLPRPVVISLSGDLGAGKTTLVRALALGLGVTTPDQVTSPTFSLVQEYEVAAGGGPIVHVDLYRLKGPADLDSLGWDELVEHSDVFLVEWPDRALGRMPDNVISVELLYDPVHSDRRLLHVKAPAFLSAVELHSNDKLEGK